MNLKDLLLDKKSAIIKKWFDAITDNYPSDTSNFLKKQKDRFLNPVGSILSENIHGLYEEIVHGIDSEKLFPYLNDIIKIKAVQDFSPSQAVSFVFLLKQVVRKELGKEITKRHLSEELTSFESRLDNLALLCFDVYMKCREKIYEIKTDEVKRMTFRLLQRANLICEIQEPDADPGAEVLTQKIKG